MYCCILRNESGLWHTFSDKIFLENFLEKLFGKDDILERCVFIMKRKRKTAREIFIVICLFLTIFLAVLFAFGRTEIPAVVYMSVCTACLFGGVAAIQE